MRLREVVLGLMVLAATAACVRLGLWQVARLREKQALNADMRARLATPALDLSGPFPPDSAMHGRRIVVHGSYDEARQVLLSAREREGEPGVEVVTPFIRDTDSTAILIDRGWLPAADAITARPRDFPEPGPRAVSGVVEPYDPPGAGGSLALLAADSAFVLSAQRLVLDSLATHFPYALAPYVLHQLPGTDVPARPSRAAPRPHDEFIHVSYAVQWFSFAAIILGGSVALRLSRRGRGVPPSPSESTG
jgi:surfeit locus 1 family protein